MSKVKITVGGDIEKDASRRFVRAWRQAARGKAVRERHLAFESWAALSRVLTGKRLELLHHVRHHKSPACALWPRRWIATTATFTPTYARWRKQDCWTWTKVACAPTTTR